MIKKSEGIKRRLLIIIGIAYFVLGACVMLSSFQGITGFLTYTGISGQIRGILGIVFLLIGIFVLITSRKEVEEGELERSIDVYKLGNNQNDASYVLLDPEMFFGKEGRVNLGRFRREIEHLRREGGEELVKIVYNRYGKALQRIAESNNERKSEVAEAFLRVLDHHYHRPRHREEQENLHLSKDEREEIKNAFRQYDGRLTQQQRDVMGKYNLEYEVGGKENKIRYKDSGYSIPISKTPSDFRTGLNTVKYIIELIEQGRRHGLEQRNRARRS